MEDKKGFDPTEAILILVGVILVGGCVLLGVVMSVVNSFPHKGGMF